MESTDEKIVKLWTPPADSPNFQSKLLAIASRLSSPLRVSALMISVITMHLLVVRPLVERVDRLQAEIHDVDSTLSKVADHRQSLSETNDLLSQLKSQHEEVARARATVRQLEQLRREIVLESERIPETIRAVARLKQLPRFPDSDHHSDESPPPLSPTDERNRSFDTLSQSNPQTLFANLPAPIMQSAQLEHPDEQKLMTASLPELLPVQEIIKHPALNDKPTAHSSASVQKVSNGWTMQIHSH
ncbi:hypothetical protein KOR42_34940 [Thalassoglobus neptunius]|uniref:Uncharacterized protein n=1 Tax=Thalassoglobus neptunius TaxID=1938619 RepID=A0A5C5WLE2_9PLAN|nr:hypothetical protein [Thalassoglobus neptunius]TWT51606.1 hypothetical protein KOR42_34940 [Thalassoglobus neptunius]